MNDINESKTPAQIQFEKWGEENEELARNIAKCIQNSPVQKRMAEDWWYRFSLDIKKNEPEKVQLTWHICLGREKENV